MNITTVPNNYHSASPHARLREFFLGGHTTCSSCGWSPLSFLFFYCHPIVYAFIVNRLDLCSSLYCGLPQVQLQPLDGILRAAARMIGGVPKFGHYQ